MRRDLGACTSKRVSKQAAGAQPPHAGPTHRAHRPQHVQRRARAGDELRLAWSVRAV